MLLLSALSLLAKIEWVDIYMNFSSSLLVVLHNSNKREEQQHDHLVGVASSEFWSNWWRILYRIAFPRFLLPFFWHLVLVLSPPPFSWPYEWLWLMALNRLLTASHLLVHLVFYTFASYGDIDGKFRYCLHDCFRLHCKNDVSQPSIVYGSKFPYWECEDDCKYSCMHEITNARREMGFGPLKYYGHWPFTRYFALEEPASVVFSLLNSIPYIYAILATLQRQPSPGT